MEPVGVEDEPSYTVGDVTDAESVEKAMEGCAAVIHGASVYTLDSRQAGLIDRVNVRGTDIVLAAAHRMGLSHIVHVSSTLALLPTQEPQLSHESLPSNPPGAYMKSKADSDRVAMKYQEQGAPVVITNPCGIWGPDDPYWGDSAQLLHNLLKTPVNVWPKGGLNIVDVRDVARVNGRRACARAEIATIRVIRRLCDAKKPLGYIVRSDGAQGAHGHGSRMEHVARRPVHARPPRGLCLSDTPSTERPTTY